MPVIKCSNGNYRIGSGKCIYTTKAKATSAYKAYLAKKGIKERRQRRSWLLLYNVLNRRIAWLTEKLLMQDYLD